MWFWLTSQSEQSEIKGFLVGIGMPQGRTAITKKCLKSSFKFSDFWLEAHITKLRQVWLLEFDLSDHCIHLNLQRQCWVELCCWCKSYMGNSISVIVRHLSLGLRHFLVALMLLMKWPRQGRGWSQPSLGMPLCHRARYQQRLNSWHMKKEAGAQHCNELITVVSNFPVPGSTSKFITKRILMLTQRNFEFLKNN